MNDWFWLKENILSSPKYTIVDTSGKIQKCEFPKLYSITKVLMGNKILYDGLKKIKQERSYRKNYSYSTSYSATCDEIVTIEKEALKLYKEAAHLGCLIAYAIIGYYHENGLAGLPVNYYKAERYYTLGLGKNILKKNSNAAGLSLIRLSFLKQYGRPGIIINQCISKKYKKQAKSLGPNVTLHWIESLAKLEHISSMFIVASSYYNGLGVERDTDKAYYYAKIAAEYGNSGAQNLVGMINYEGTKTLEKNEEMALKWYRKAAKSNEAAALYNLAMLYENGVVVLQNYNEAYKYYKMSSELGSISGTNIIGFFNEHGIGTERKRITAFLYYQKAASKGSPFGQYNLGRCFLYGIGVKKNATQALKWFELAGTQGHGNSYLTLGILYDMGIIVMKNQKLARKYYTLAYRNNVKAVGKRLEAGIAIDVLRVARILLSSSVNDITLLSNNSSYKNSCDTLYINNSVEDIYFSSQTNSLLKFLVNNSILQKEEDIEDDKYENSNSNNTTTVNNAKIIPLGKDIDIDMEELNKINSEKTSHTTNNNTNEDIDENMNYSSSYRSLATSSSSINTLVSQDYENKNEENEENEENDHDTSLEISEIMEYIQQFNPTTQTTQTTQNNVKRNLLSELPNELKYHIIRTLNPDGILSENIINKIFRYVIYGDKQDFKTKTDFLTYLGIEEFKLEQKIHSSREEELINSLIDQFHKN